jgi:hypothetical protein
MWFAVKNFHAKDLQAMILAIFYGTLFWLLFDSPSKLAKLSHLAYQIYEYDFFFTSLWFANSMTW